MPERFDSSSSDLDQRKHQVKSAPKNKKDSRGGARKGAGKHSLESKNMTPIMVKLSLLNSDWDAINKYTNLRENTNFRVEILRDILSFVTKSLEESGLSETEQAEATKDLEQFFRNKYRKEE